MAAPQRLQGRDRPNVVLILADDLGYGDISAYNGGLSHTPALDGLIRDGTTLSQHYAASPVCNPSRAALLTGRYPHRTGSVDTLDWWGLERLALRERTLGDILRANGYATGLIGKWHLGSYDPRYHPMRRGFDETVCFRGGMHDYWSWRIEVGESVRRSNGEYLTDVWTTEAARFIERHRDAPFFLHLTFNAPHVPLQAPDDEVAPFLGKEGVPTTGVATLYGMAHRMDSGIAHLLDTLRRLGLEENTIVIFTSDNGPDLVGEGDEALVRFNCGFNGGKYHVYEGGIRVPAVIRWPAGLAHGRVVHETFHFTDWLPTILAMTGATVPDGGLALDGVDRLSVLRGEPAAPAGPRCWQWNRYVPLPQCNAAIRDGDWKLIRPWREHADEVPDAEPWLVVSMYEPEYFVGHGIFQPPYPAVVAGAPGRPVLFNIADDPLEQHDLAPAEPDRVARLAGRLDRWFDEVERDRRTIDDG